MSLERLARWSGLVFIASGILIFLARVMQVALFGDAPWGDHAASDSFVLALGIPALFGTILYQLGVVGLYARQARQTGVPTLIVFLFTFITMALFAGGNWAYAFTSRLLYQLNAPLLKVNLTDPAWYGYGPAYVISMLSCFVGWLLLLVATWQSRALPRWASGLALAASVISFLPIFTATGISSLVMSFFISLSPVIIGYALYVTPVGTTAGSQPGTLPDRRNSVSTARI